MIEEEREAGVSVPSRLWSDGLPRWVEGRVFNSVMRAFAWLVGIAALRTAAGALPSPHPLPILMCLMMVVPATAIHEAGHAFAARRNGMRVIEMHVWLLNIVPLSRGLRWRFASPPKGVGGLVTSIPDPSRPLRPAMLWLMTGGPLANLAAALACLPPAVWGSPPALVGLRDRLPDDQSGRLPGQPCSLPGAPSRQRRLAVAAMAARVVRGRT